MLTTTPLSTFHPCHRLAPLCSAVNYGSQAPPPPAPPGGGGGSSSSNVVKIVVPIVCVVGALAIVGIVVAWYMHRKRKRQTEAEAVAARQERRQGSQGSQRYSQGTTAPQFQTGAGRANL